MSEIPGPDETLPPIIPLNEPTWQNEPTWMPPPAESLPPPAPLLRPVPFEDFEALPGFWARVGAMFRLVFTNPMELFDRVPVTESLGAPFRFLLLLSLPVFLLTALLLFFMGIGMTMAALDPGGNDAMKGLAAASPVVMVLIILLLPLFIFIGMLIGGGLSHLFLWMWGGTKNGVGLQNSIRAYGYGSAFTQLAGFIPYLGPLIQLAGWVVIMLGIARMHRAETWRGVCALITQIVVFCCCLFVTIWALIMLIARHT